MNETKKEPFDALHYSSLKDRASNREKCEHCDREYRQKCVLWKEANGNEVTFSADVECDDCHDMRKDLDKLLKLGFEIRDRLEREQRIGDDSEKSKKRLAELYQMRDTQRLRYKAALDCARSALYQIRKNNGKK